MQTQPHLLNICRIDRIRIEIGQNRIEQLKFNFVKANALLLRLTELERARNNQQSMLCVTKGSFACE